ncbi:MAG TPA: calcium-binding protein [Nitrospira sp.]|nr:calcium-binding protein [Nitrospira sp.]
MNNLLMKSILAMDSYNRGYDEVIPLQGNQIGSALILMDSGVFRNPDTTRQDDDISFYAIAYNYNGEKIISYRGTDNFDQDLLYGYTVGGGFPNHQQAEMAFGFYNVVSGGVDPRTANISLTGHSLGGGLAGLVAAVYGQQGTLFDNMAFEAAALMAPTAATIDSTFKALAYGSISPWQTPVFSTSPTGKLRTYSLDGEFLGFNRQLQQTYEDPYELPGNPNIVKGPDAFHMHSMASLVIHTFAETELAGVTSWHAASPYFWPVLYQDGFAQSIGEQNSGNLRAKIAYSALETGERPFGDTAIRAMYDDANDFGRVIQKAGLSQLLLAHIDDITKSYVHFAGLLALNDIEKKDQPHVLTGILSYPGTTNATLSVNFSENLWQGVNKGEMPVMSTRAEFLGELYNEIGNSSIRNATLKMWGNDTVNVIDRVVFAMTETGGASKIETLATNNEGTLFVGGAGADTVTGSDNHELFYTGKGDDVVNAGSGDDIILGSAGNDIIDGYVGNDLIDYSSSPGAVSTISAVRVNDGWGGQDRLTGIENFIFTRYDDNLFFVTLPTIGGSRISYDGGDGNDKINFSGNVVHDINNNRYYNESGTSRVTITNFETVSSDTRLVIPPSGTWTAPINTPEYIFDYSAGTSSIVFDLVAAHFNGPDGGYSGPRAGSIIGGGFSHTLPVVPYEEDREGLYTGANIGSIYGSHHGDTFYTNWFSHSYDLHTGRGNDTVYIYLAAGDFFKIHYTGGNDIYNVTESIEEIRLDPSIILSDITNIHVTSNTDADFFATLTINGFGTIKINHTDFGRNSVPVILDSGGQITFTAGQTNYTVSGSSQVFTTLYGTWGNDIWSSRTGYSQTYFGRSGDDTLYGNDGDDALYGGEGIDRLYGGEGIDELWGGFGADIIEGGNGNDNIYGEDENDTLIGGAGSDVMSGGVGNDVITGGAGLDYLYGDAGADTYVFAAGDSPTSTPDIVYAESIDTIKLTGISPQNAQVYKLNGVWHVRYTANDDITIQPWRDMSATAIQSADNFIGKIVFDNGTVWDFSNGYTINDTDASNSMEGTNLSDTLNGRGGNDLIHGVGGNDILIGGTGMDSLWGGKGDDTYVFAVGDSSSGDFVSDVAGEGTDTIKLTGVLPQNVYLTVGAFDSLEIQYSPTDKISVKGWIPSDSGSSGSTARYAAEKIVFDNGTVWDITAGLTLNDSNDAHDVNGTEFSDIINANGGDDRIFANAGNDTVNAGTGNDSIFDSSGSDILNGGDGNDYISGGSNGLFSVNSGISDNDVIDGGRGIDDLYGSWGDDTYVFRAGDSPVSTPDWIREVVGQGTDTIKLIGGVLPANVTFSKKSNEYWYSLKFGTDEIRIVNYVPSGSVMNTTSTLAVEKIAFDNGTVLNLIDLLNAAPVNPYPTTTGNDTINASAATAAVTINLLAGNDAFTGSNFNDNVTAGDGNDTVEGRGGNDIMTGGAGTDTVTYAGATVAVTVNLATTAAQNTVGAGTDTISAFENLTGSNYNDTLTGDANANVIEGGNGNDIIKGGAGNDSIQGGVGNDTLVGETGTDTVTYAAATAAVTVNLAMTAAQNTVGAGTDTISTFENLTGSGYNDTLTGDANANTIKGGAGNDTIQGGAGNDILDGEAGTDTVTYAAATAAVTVNLATTTAQATGSVGSDTITNFENLTGSGYNDTLRGNTANNTLVGGNGNDILYGNSGNDLLYGDAGTDTLYGDAGNDTLNGGASNDVLYGGVGSDIFKFSSGGGIDTIKDFKKTELDKIDIKDLLSGYDPVTKAITDFIQITTSGTNSIVKIDANGLTGGTAWTQIATLENITGLTDELALKNAGTIIA